MHHGSSSASRWKRSKRTAINLIVIEGKHWQLDGYVNEQVYTQDQIPDWCDRLHLRVEPEDERNMWIAGPGTQNISGNKF
jgi:hypothetical protein